MANALYPTYKESLLTGTSIVDYDTDTIKLALIKITGTGAVSYNTAHDFYDDLSSGVVGTPQTLGTKTTTSGKASSAAVTFTAVSSAGNTLGAVLYKDTGTPATSRLIAWYDTGTNIPATPNGGDITITPDGTNGWFTL
jgi:hypothetical protein